MGISLAEFVEERFATGCQRSGISWMRYAGMVSRATQVECFR